MNNGQMEFAIFYIYGREKKDKGKVFYKIY